MVRKPQPSPREHARDWPNDELRDPSAETARQLVVNLRQAIAGRSLREVGEMADVDFTSVARMLNGETWPTITTITRLEMALGAELWPAPAVRHGTVGGAGNDAVGHHCGNEDEGR